MDLSKFSDEELQQIAGYQPQKPITQEPQGLDMGSMSDDELMKIAGIQPQKQISQNQSKKTKFVGGLVGQALKDPRSLEAFGRKALESATFGFEKRITPVISAGVGKLAGLEAPYGELYKEARGLEEEKKQQLAQQFPKATIGGAIAGGVASPINIAGLKTAKAVGGGLLGAMAGGGVEGAIAGLGYTEDLQDPDKVIKDITGGAGIGAMTGGALYGIGKGISAISSIAKKPFERFTNQKKLASKNIAKTLIKESIDPKVALQRMTDEGLDLIDVVDPRSAIVSSLPEKTYEKASVDLVDDYTNRLNKAGNKAREKILDMVSDKKISDLEGAELIGKNAQETINRQLKIRSAKAKPLYDKVFKSKKQIIPLDDEILKRPVVQEAIQKAKAESKKFGNTAVGSLEGKPDNSLIVLHQAKDYLYRKSKDFTDLENFRYKQVYNELSEKLKAKSPLYRQATKIWAGETEGLEKLYKQKGIGNFAKKYAKNDIDGIRTTMKNIFNPATSLEEVKRIKDSMPAEEFMAFARKDLSDVIENAGEKGRVLDIALFGQAKDIGLKNKKLDLIFTPIEKKGLKKAVSIIDKARIRAKETAKIKFGKMAKLEATPISFRKLRATQMLDNVFNRMTESPQYREEFIRYLTTPEGKRILEMMSKSTAKNTESLLFNLLGAIETTRRE